MRKIVVEVPDTLCLHCIIKKKDDGYCFVVRDYRYLDDGPLKACREAEVKEKGK